MRPKIQKITISDKYSGDTLLDVTQNDFCISGGTTTIRSRPIMQKSNMTRRIFNSTEPLANIK